MTLSHPIDDRSGRHQSRWFASSNAAARDASLDSKRRCARILPLTEPQATVPSRLHLTPATSQLLPLNHATILNSHAATKSP
jgi:hypothetical protein